MSTTPERQNLVGRAVEMEGGSSPSGSRTKRYTNVLAKRWNESGLSLNMIMLSLKGALPPTIALAAYQAPTWSKTYSTDGFFLAVVAFLSMATQPRGKFFQTMFMLVIFIGLASALNLLMIFCAVSVRNATNNTDLHVGSSGSIESTTYDASANTVAAAWLFLNVFAASFLKAKFPGLSVPALQYNFYSITASIYAPSLPDMASGFSFIRGFAITFYTAYALAIAVHVVVWPTTSRGEVERKSAELLSGLKDCIQSYTACIESFGVDANKQRSGEDDSAQQIKTLKDKTQDASGLFGDIKMSLDFARKEVAIGKLTPQHLNRLYVGLREVLQPVMGLSTFLRLVVDAQHDDIGTEGSSSDYILEGLRKLEADEWSTIVTEHHETHAKLQEVMSQALDHISIQLGLISRPKNRRTDVERSGQPVPGDTTFANHFERELEAYHHRNGELSQLWIRKAQSSRERRQQQLSLMAYLNFLFYNAGTAILRQVHFADGLVADGTMKRRRFIFPGCRQLSELMMGPIMDPGQDEAMGMHANNGSNIWVGDLLNHAKDPEHLPPANTYEKVSDCIRRIPHALSSQEAGFGLRVAVATLSLALAAFLAPSRPFFLRQRGVWAVTLTAIAMIPQLGASMPAFCMRILGTFAAAVISIVIVYIADHTRPGVIVLFFVQSVGWLLFEARSPSHELTVIVGEVAVIIIVGYQLQVETIGRAAATKNGQAYYPVYLLAVYRFTAIVIGLAVAFFWSIFPFPVTSHGSLRQDTVKTLHVLANYHSCVHTTLDVYPRVGPDFQKLADDHPVKRLDEARQELFAKSISLLGRLRGHHHAAKFEPQIGGKFPSDQHEQVIESLSKVFTYLTLLTYSAKAFVRDSEYQTPTDDTLEDSDKQKEKEWIDSLLEPTARDPATSLQLTLTLSLLAMAIENGQPVLPHVLASSRRNSITPKDNAFGTTEPQMLAHPCYVAFVINEITGSLIYGEVAKLALLIKDLVGEVKFQFNGMDESMDEMSTVLKYDR